MPRLRIIILEQEDLRTFRYALWADVPAVRQSLYANTAATSAWRDALPADIAALQAGRIVERTDTLGVPPGGTVAQAQAILEATWQTFQDRVTARNPWVRYGTTWNGAAWVLGGVA